MREIKFRGKRLDNNEWVYGGIWYYNTAVIESVCIVDDGDDYAVDANTVGQYTGIKDCNDTEIYKGDIFEQCYTDVVRGKKIKNQYLVFYQDGYFQARYKGRLPTIPTATLLYFFFDEVPNQCTVIGNMYENPELLEVAK